MLHRLVHLSVLAFATLFAATLLPPASDAMAQESPVAVRAVPQYPSVPQGGVLVVAVEMAHKEHYHSWPAEEVKLPEAIAEFAIRTEVGLANDKAGNPVVPSWIIRVLGVQAPEARPGKVADPLGGPKPIEVPLYSDKAVFYLRAEVKPDAPLGEQTLGVRVFSQSCNEQTCDMPREELREVKVKVVPAGAADLGQPIDPGLFEKYDAGKGIVAPSRGTTPSPTPKPAANGGTGNAPSVPPAAPMSGSFFGFSIGSSAAVLLFFGAVGGFLLNLTPCVLPVIPIKILSLTQHATSRSHAIVLGAWMACGVIAFWVLAGIPMALVSSTLDPSRYIFGVWWITISIGLVVALFGLGIMGLFNITLPQSVYAIESKADSPIGSLMFGVLTAVLGLPCFGFVVGGLLAGAATLPWYAIMAVFVGMGVGMALPYFILSAYPNLLKFIPRTGPASDLLKQVMGFLLLAGAAFFITAGLKALILDVPYVTGSIAWWVVGFFILLGSAWMVFRTFKISRAIGGRFFVAVLAIAMVLGIGLFAQGKLADDRKEWVDRGGPSGHAPIASGAVPTGKWLDYTPELFAAVRASGRPVFLDFTADWCINCKAFKKLFLTQGPAATRLQSSDIVLMEVDCTSTHAPGWDLLKELGRTGVPTWVVYGPGTARNQPMIIDLTTPSAKTVLDAIDAAGVPVPGKKDAAALPSGQWIQYTPERLAAARAANRAVFIDFVADWDVNCRAMSKLLLHRGPVSSRLISSDIVLLEANCTTTNAPGWALLKELGRTSIPTWVVYGPGGVHTQPKLIDLTTPTVQTVLDAIDAAGVPSPGPAEAAIPAATASIAPSR